tara:strand:+ start:4193 stop:5275 length:1083 start_codon:yes stop_codon:yes gene_type:complete
MDDSASVPELTYGSYLQLDDLLSLQRNGKDISNDELHFIIVHQTFELWFKQIIHQLKEVRDELGASEVPEKAIPSCVHGMRRVTEIFGLMAHQWSVLETLTPQGFLAFRDELGTASGFESYQMRELEIVLGLTNSMRGSNFDPIEQFRKIVSGDPGQQHALDKLIEASSKPSLLEVVMSWVKRTPIMGSRVDDPDDAITVENYVQAHLEAFNKHSHDQQDFMMKTTDMKQEMVESRFDAARSQARDFLLPGGDVDRARAGLLFIESYRELPLLTWPRALVDAVVELEESMVKWRHSHARMVERIIGRRVGTGGSSGVDYLDATAAYRVFTDLWGVRTVLVRPGLRPKIGNPEFYGFTVGS